ncbi:MAG: O-antigen ligase family protein, partial [Candidatus Komeilibacteria bacterium]
RKIHLTKQFGINFAGFSLLIIAGVLSFYNIWPDQFAESFKYLWRFIAFNYLLYFLLVQEIVRKAKQFWTLSWFIYALGIFLSIMGLVSFYWPEVNHSFPMATPLSWFGLFPLGASHNLLAESLVSIIPFSWLLIYKLGNDRRVKYLNYGLSLMIAVCILTFSRTGWLVLALELLILYITYYRVKVTSIIQKYWPLALGVLLLFGVYFITFAQTDFVTSSNEARLAMIERSVYMFDQHPFLGNGVGTWQPMVSQDMYYVYEFGQPLEQHGVVWKLMAEQGLFGILIWFTIMFYMLYYSYYIYHRLEHDNPWQMAALVAGVVIVGQIVFQLLDTGYYSPKMWLPLGLAMALLHIAKRYQGLLNKIIFDN